jgi:hypothetical protein
MSPEQFNSMPLDQIKQYIVEKSDEQTRSMIVEVVNNIRRTHVPNLIKHVIWEDGNTVCIATQDQYQGNYEDTLTVEVDINSPAYLKYQAGFYVAIQRMWYMGVTPIYVKR